MKLLNIIKKIMMAAALLGLLSAVAAAHESDSEPSASQAAPVTLSRGQEARLADSRYRLEKAIREDRYPSILASLNVWRNVAMEAGVFDPERYNAIRREALERSIREVAAWVDVCVAEDLLYEAVYCQKVYAFHARAIGEFNPDLYAEIDRKIKERREAIDLEKQRARKNKRQSP